VSQGGEASSKKWEKEKGKRETQSLIRRGVTHFDEQTAARPFSKKRGREGRRGVKTRSGYPVCETKSLKKKKKRV